MTARAFPLGAVLKNDEFTSRDAWVSIDGKVVGLVIEAKVGPHGYVTRWAKDGKVTEHGDVKAWRDEA